MNGRDDENGTAGSGLLSRPVLIGCLINGCMGVMYAWSLFLLPIERDIGLSRAELSLLPSLALVFRRDWSRISSISPLAPTARQSQYFLPFQRKDHPITRWDQTPRAKAVS